MVNYSIERISPENLVHVQALYRAAFHKRALDFLLRKHDTEFSGARFIGFLAFTPDRSPAAFYGVFPCLLRIEGKTILAAQSADTMTHPGHRRQGLFVRLAKETYNLAKENGIELIFGFPNEHSHSGFAKLNWVFQPAPMKLFRFAGSSLPFSKIVRRIPILKKVLIKYLKHKYRVAPGDASFPDDLRNGILRNNQFIAYKKYSSSFFLRIDGAPVWLNLDSDLKVGYADVNTITSPESFLRSLREIARLSGCRHIIFITSVNSPLYNMLIAIGRPEDSFPVGFYSITGRQGNLEDVRFEYCDIDIF